ncbi:MAG TPA: hypothetical protein VE130_07895 [Nitrososphaeraceae archaeon]|jgi:hypothetical protein|nr:hypothetical protein [Nitrososphaeraceae archaeon]
MIVGDKGCDSGSGDSGGGGGGTATGSGSIAKLDLEKAIAAGQTNQTTTNGNYFPFLKQVKHMKVQKMFINMAR